MPTFIGMPVVRRALVARGLCVAFAASLGFQALVPAAASAAPAPPATPPTTAKPAPPKPAPPGKDAVPPPPAFTLPLDVGTKLVQQGKLARIALLKLTPQLTEAK